MKLSADNWTSIITAFIQAFATILVAVIGFLGVRISLKSMNTLKLDDNAAPDKSSADKQQSSVRSFVAAAYLFVVAWFISIFYNGYILWKIVPKTGNVTRYDILAISASMSLLIVQVALTITFVGLEIYVTLLLRKNRFENETTSLSNTETQLGG